MMTQPVVKKMKYKLRLEEKVIGTDDGTDSLYLVVRIKAQLERKLNLWKRATNKVTPEHTLRVKFIGEDGIDTGENFTPINSRLQSMALFAKILGALKGAPRSAGAQKQHSSQGAPSQSSQGRKFDQS